MPLLLHSNIMTLIVPMEVPDCDIMISLRIKLTMLRNDSNLKPIIQTERSQYS